MQTDHPLLTWFFVSQQRFQVSDRSSRRSMRYNNIEVSIDFRGRVDAYINAIVETVRTLSSDMEEVKKKFQKEECRQAFVRGIFEAAQAFNTDKAEAFGRIFGTELNSADPVWDEASALISRFESAN